MRDPEMFKYDVRVRDRMLRGGRISAEEVNGILETLPDLDGECEAVPLNQPALDLAATGNSISRSSYAVSPVGEATDEPSPSKEVDE